MNARPLKPRPIQQGAVSPENAERQVVGRTKMAKRLWKNLEGGSVELLAQRRMGKTWLLKLMLALTPSWAVAVFFDAEACASAPEFVWALNRRMHAEKLISNSRFERVSAWFRRVLQRLQKQSVGTAAVPTLDPWQALLEATCREFAKHAGHGRKAVLMIDEFPYFLDKLLRAGRQDEAIQVLDVMRGLRADLPEFRFIFCGSLGLHVVLSRLREGGYTNQPVNDMLDVDVPPLSSEDAAYLAGCLLLGERTACSDEDLPRIAAIVAEASSGVPFYIQRMVQWMSTHPDPAWTPERAAEILTLMFDEPQQGGLAFDHNERLDLFYPEDDTVDKARAALDVLSRSPEGESFDVVLNAVRHNPKTEVVDPDELRKVLDLLFNDHYLAKSDSTWRFKLDIIRDWWYATRGRNT